MDALFFCWTVACFGSNLCDPPGRAELSAAISGAAF